MICKGWRNGDIARMLNGDRDSRRFKVVRKVNGTSMERSSLQKLMDKQKAKEPS